MPQRIMSRRIMSQRPRWLLAILVASVLAVSAGVRGQEPPKPKKLTAEDVAKRWSPDLKSATEYGQIGGSPKQSPDVAAYSFRVLGPTFEELWNHYARLCGIKERYAEKTFLTSADTGPNGSYVVSDRAAADGKGGRGLSVFLLKADAYTATVTFQGDPGRQVAQRQPECRHSVAGSDRPSHAGACLETVFHPSARRV